MAYVIAEPCVDVMDLSCVSVCPVDCIHYDEGADRKLFIDPNECIDCGACEPECPVNAIFPEESLPTEWAQYTQADALWFTDKAAGPRARRRAQARLIRARPRPAAPDPDTTAPPGAGPSHVRRPVVPSATRRLVACVSSPCSRPPPRSCSRWGSVTSSWASPTSATTRRRRAACPS